MARRSVITPEDPRALASFLVCAPAARELAVIARVLGQRWAIESGFAASKGEVGLDHDEARSWQSWYRHITLALLAHAFLAVVRAQTRATDTLLLPLCTAVPDSLRAFKRQRGLVRP